MNGTENPLKNQIAGIWRAITEIRKCELARLKAQNASMRAQLVLLNYEKNRIAQHEETKPEEKIEIFTTPEWRRRPRRRHTKHAQSVPIL